MGHAALGRHVQYVQQTGKLGVIPSRIETRNKLPQRPARHPGIEVLLLRDVADPPFLLDANPLATKTQQLDPARNLAQNAHQHPDRGGLSRTVPAQKAEKLTSINPNVQILHSPQAAELDEQVLVRQ